MDAKDLKNCLKTFSEDLYEFAYALKGDSNWAKTAAVDALTSVDVDENINKIVRDIVIKGEFYAKELFEIKGLLYKRVFFLAKNLKKHFFTEQHVKSPYYHLSLTGRAVYFLRKKCYFELYDIGSVVDMDAYQTMNILHEARNELADLSGVRPPSL